MGGHIRFRGSNGRKGVLCADGDGEDALSMRLSLKPASESTDSPSQTSSRPKVDGPLQSWKRWEWNDVEHSCQVIQFLAEEIDIHCNEHLARTYPTRRLLLSSAK